MNILNYVKLKGIGTQPLIISKEIVLILKALVLKKKLHEYKRW